MPLCANPAGAHAHRSPAVTASRLPSFQSQTRNGTVAGRFPDLSRKSQLRFAASGPHSPPRWRTRGLRCDLPQPSARRRLLLRHVWPVNFTWSRSSTRTLLPYRAALTQPSLRHTDGCVLAEPSYNIKNRRWGQTDFGGKNGELALKGPFWLSAWLSPVPPPRRTRDRGHPALEGGCDCVRRGT